MDRWIKLREAFIRTDKTQALLQGSFGSMILWVFSLGIRMLSGVMLARWLGASAYGTYSYALSWLAFLTIPSMLGLDQILVRFVSAYKETKAWAKLRGCLKYAILHGFSSSIIASIISITIVAFIPGLESDLRITLRISFAILPIIVLAQIRQASLRGLDRPVLSQIPENIIYPGFIILLLLGMRYLGESILDAPTAASINAIAWIGAFLIGAVILIRKLPEEVRTSVAIYEKPLWVKMMLPLVFSGGAYYITSRADLLVLGALETTRDVGIYAASSRIAEQLMMFVYTAVTLSGTSLFSGIYSTGDIKELQRFTNLITKSIMWTSLPLYLALLLFAPWILSIFGPEYVEGVGVMRFLITTFYISSLSGPVIAMLYMTGNQNDAAITMGITAGVNLLLSFLLISQFGMIGAAYSSGLSLLLLHSVLVYILYRRVGIISLPFNILKITG